jgi:glycerol-3-phosphate acyltransferase PlsY
MWLWLAVLALAYLLGSIPMGVLVVRWMRGIDVRQVGSGRTGGTNVMRAAGWKAALLCGIGDIGKAALAVLIAQLAGAPAWVMALAGSLAVVGHNYPIFLRSKGGAGTAPSIGAAAVLWPWVGLALAPILLLVVFITRRASLGSIVVALLIPAAFLARALHGFGPWDYLIYGVLTSALTLWALRPNIERLLQGAERRIEII